MGKTSSAPVRNIVTMCSTMDSVDRTLQRFLENDDVPTVEKSSQADLECERIYQSTTTCQPDGRYIVHLPFQQDPPLLGKSKDVALRRLEQLENRFKRGKEVAVCSPRRQFMPGCAVGRDNTSSDKAPTSERVENTTSVFLNVLVFANTFEIWTTNSKLNPVCAG